MPIYEYLCNSCGTKNEHMQKMSDTPIRVCPECGSENYVKQISAAGFQLKGSGWYVTDFKNKPSQSTAKTEKSGVSSKQTDNQKGTTEKTSKTATASAQTADSKSSSSTTAATD
ncbi:FmdB family zinc ribbon protein [Nitrosomonas sp. Nm51]|uniref:FmdB family zinc ribbon protein n=1 Tax=Nitrosomonas sp. Nm51 TaxID=133720 RepID=UPI000B84F1FF|nr:zinc ribbon domain-containing protein [Nitrosomonas sp. Nm51]